MPKKYVSQIQSQQRYREGAEVNFAGKVGHTIENDGGEHLHI
jgi:hypothetical protein